MSNLEFFGVFQSLLAKQPPTAAGRPVVSITNFGKIIKMQFMLF